MLLIGSEEKQNIQAAYASEKMNGMHTPEN